MGLLGVAGIAGAVGLFLFLQSRGLPTEKQFKDALAKIAAKPDDKTANKTAAHYLAFVADDFAQAEQFAIIGDPLLAGAITEEKKYDNNKFTAVEIGDAWLKAGDKAGSLKPAYRDRAIYWYGRGWEAGLNEDPVWGDKLRTRLELLQMSPVKQAYMAGNMKGWTLWGGAFIGLKYARSGRRSAALSNGLNKAKEASGTQVEGAYHPVPAAARGKPFVLTAWVLTDKTDLAGNAIQLNIVDGAGVNLHERSIPLATDQPYWKKYVYTNMMPATAAKFRIVINSRTESGMVYVDDISFIADDKDILPNGSFEQ